MMPPEMFPPDLQPIIYFTLMPSIILFGALFLVVFWFLVIPPEAKTYIKNKLSKKDMFDVETESGVRILDTGKIYPEGIAILDKTKLIVPVPRPVPNQQLQLNLAASGELTEDKLAEVKSAVQDAERLTLKPSVVKGLGCRIYRVFQSTALATTLATLVGLEYDGNSKHSFMAIPVLTKNGKRVEPATLLIKKGKKSVGELNDWVTKVFLPVDPNVIRKYFNPQFSPSQADAMQKLGEALERERSGSMLKKWMFPLIIIAMVVVVAIILVVMLGGGGVAQPVQ
jgi:hypothetical protein